jgi:hypothetical protein
MEHLPNSLRHTDHSDIAIPPRRQRGPRPAGFPPTRAGWVRLRSQSPAGGGEGLPPAPSSANTQGRRLTNESLPVKSTTLQKISELSLPEDWCGSTNPRSVLYRSGCPTQPRWDQVTKRLLYIHMATPDPIHAMARPAAQPCCEPPHGPRSARTAHRHSRFMPPLRHF